VTRAPLARIAGLFATAIFTLLLLALPARAADDPAFEDRIKKLESELRCLVCQNQTLADSGSELAGDLRNEVRKLALDGRSDNEIKSYLVARYGDFVLYRPPVKSTTWLLWAGPFVLLLLGAGVWWQVLRRRRTQPPAPALSADDRDLARRLLEGDSPSAKG
jgi:cytochrome c-type biogenesis protein CcmH